MGNGYSVSYEAEAALVGARWMESECDGERRRVTVRVDTQQLG
jgi:hypothetical protein